MYESEYLNPLFTETEIQQRIIELSHEILDEFGENELIIVGLLKGAFIFLSDLVRQLHRLHIPLLIDFIDVSSYGDGTTSSGRIELNRDISLDTLGRSVLLVDDILDTGRTLAFVYRHLLERKTAIQKTCVMLDKPDRRVVPFEADYIGFRVPDRFIVGYGLDHANRYRELPYIAMLDK